MSAYRQQVTFAPESGNMMGGTIVNVTGPCFDRTRKITCRFNTIKVPGAVIDENRATCVMPPMYATGYVDFAVAVDGSNDLHWKGKFLVETPFTAPELVSFPENDQLERNPQKLTIHWDYKNLTLDTHMPVSITLYGYRENTINPELVYIDTLAVCPHNDLHTVLISDADSGPFYPLGINCKHRRICDQSARFPQEKDAMGS